MKNKTIISFLTALSWIFMFIGAVQAHAQEIRAEMGVDGMICAI